MTILVGIIISFIIGLIVALISGNNLIGWIVGIIAFLFSLIGEVIDFIFGGRRDN